MAEPRPCSVDGCDSRAVKRGWCEMHYARWKRQGDPLKVLKRQRRWNEPRVLCRLENCEKPADRGGMCKWHANLSERFGDPLYTPPPCSIKGCARPHAARGWCLLHYQRWRKHGDPLYVGTKRGAPVMTAERFASFIDYTSWDDCWHWTGTINSKGYPTVGWKGFGTSSAYRVAFKLAFGFLPASPLEIDHRCHSVDLSCPGGNGCLHRRCVNPFHLEVVTHHLNSLRSRNRQAEKTHCKHGHEYTPGNTYLVNGRNGVERRCKTCQHHTYLRRKAKDRGHASPHLYQNTRAAMAALPALKENKKP